MLDDPPVKSKAVRHMKIFVMIPTFNERENVGRLIEKIKDLGIAEIQIVVVDDNSPDGTAELLRELMKTYDGIHLLLRRENKGRGFAGVEGFKYCLAEGADYVIEMDADLSHNPAHFPQFLEKAGKYDVVIGSRFLKGSKNARSGIVRNFITWFARSYVCAVLGLKVTDPTSGYRCFRSEVLKEIHLESTISSGPAIVQEILYKAHRHGFSICEIPIVFEDRAQGKSTFNFHLAIQGFLMIFLFRLIFSKPKKPEVIEIFRSSDNS